MNYLTLQDIADVARVQRPVVSAWRSRTIVGGEHVPFPAPTAEQSRVEYFDCDDVIAWIQRTGRGNNPEFALDAHAAAVPEGATLNQLTALLTLAVTADTELSALEADELVDLADETDPDDEFVFTEVESIAAHITQSAAYIDRLREVSFGPADAYERLCRTRLGRAQRSPRYSRDAIHLLTSVVGALSSASSEVEPARMWDVSAGRIRLGVDVASALAESTGVALSFDVDASPDSLGLRRQRRAALLYGVPTADTHNQPGVALLPVHDLPELDAIDAIDELQLSLGKDMTGVVIGPSSLLCDVLDDPELETGRDAIVRTGTLRFAARLPRGLWPSAPRQALGLWVFGTQSARRIEDRTIALADVSQLSLDATTIHDLTSDISGAVGNVTGRAFGFSRVARTSRLIAARELVPPGSQATPHIGPNAADRLVRIENLLSELAATLPEVETTVKPADASGSMARPSTLSLRMLIDAGQLSMISGTRLNPDHVPFGGSIRVFEPMEGNRALNFDPLELHLHYPRAARTEPGDVVFAHTPRPAARVDEQGGSVVAFPARILRPSAGSHIGSHVLARTINRLPDDAREWKSWQIPVVDGSNARQLEDTLASLTEVESALNNRIRVCHELADELTDAAAAHAVHVQTTERN